MQIYGLLHSVVIFYLFLTMLISKTDLSGSFFAFLLTSAFKCIKFARNFSK